MSKEYEINTEERDKTRAYEEALRRIQLEETKKPKFKDDRTSVEDMIELAFVLAERK